MNKYLNRNITIVFIAVYLIIMPACYADIYVFPDSNDPNATLQNVSPQGNYENYIKKPYHNPNLIEEDQQYKLQKDYIKAYENRSYYNYYPNYGDYSNSYNFSPYDQTINPPHPLNYDETTLPPIEDYFDE